MKYILKVIEINNILILFYEKKLKLFHTLYIY